MRQRTSTRETVNLFRLVSLRLSSLSVHVPLQESFGFFSMLLLCFILPSYLVLLYFLLSPLGCFSLLFVPGTLTFKLLSSVHLPFGGGGGSRFQSVTT